MAVKFASLLLMLLLQGGVSSDSIFGGDPGSGRIIGGEEVDAGKYPWFARSVSAWGGWGGCGGSLVTPEFVLTASHCPYDTDMSFQIGALCSPYETDENCEQKIEQFGIEKVYKHPDYNPTTQAHDIALIKLDSQSTIPPVAMDQGSTSPGYTKGKELFAIGFGNTNPNAPGYYPDHLRDVAVEFVPADECDDVYSIDSTMLCAASDGKDSCQGDSGGPLYDAKNKILVGITSWGYGCAQDGFPGVYSNIADQVGWVQETICQDHSPSNKPAFCDGITPPPTDPPVPAPSFVPSESPAPTKDITSSPSFSDDCDSDKIFVLLSLKTDQYPTEISWSLTNKQTGDEVGSGTYDDSDNHKEFGYKFCIPQDTCFQFEIEDSYGDGILNDGNVNDGFYKLEADGATVLSNLDGRYFDKESATFNCPVVSCDSGESKVSIEIEMDIFPWEISWELTNVVTDSVVDSSPTYNSDNSLETLLYEYCIPEDTCHAFEIYDSYGDGLSGASGTDSGSYTISLDDTVVGSGVDFGYEDKVQLACDEEECEDDSDKKIQVTIEDVGSFDKRCKWYESEGYCQYTAVVDVCRKTCDACGDEGDNPTPAPTCGTDFKKKFEVTIPGEGTVKKKCKKFAEGDYCQYDEVKEKCPESCGCGDIPTAAPVCEEPSGRIELFVNGEDLKKKCTAYSNEGYCEFDEVKEKCPVSCGECGDSPTTAPCEVLDPSKMVVDKEPFDELCNFLVERHMCGVESVSAACSSACGRP